MRQRYPSAIEVRPPDDVEGAIEAVRALLRGEQSDLSWIALDMDRVPVFNRRVYEIARKIPRGRTLSYGDIAARLGDLTLARAVGQALGSNPFPPIVPCHRVVSADGRMHGFSSPGGVAAKLRLLSIEGWEAQGGPTLFDAADR
jgi:methylated-DNA-[protein]-cysteine S-methyltransferase